MKFGIGEIILIIVIAFTVLLVVRIIKMAQTQGRTGQPTEEDEESTQGVNKISPRTRIILIGILITILGVVVLFSSLSLIKWVFWGPIGALIAMVAGITLVLLARKR